jgi:hypothetical protein
VSAKDLLQQIHVAEILRQHAPLPGADTEDSGPLVHFWESLSPGRRREMSARAEPSLAPPERPGEGELAAFLADLADRLPEVPPRDLALLYEQIPTPDGQELAAGAVAFLEDATPLDRQLGERMLLLLGCLVPEALHGLHERLIRVGMVWPGELFRGASSDARDLLLSLLPDAGDGEALPFLLSALAWIGDPVVRLRFEQWRREPPLWAVNLETSPDQHALDAAWHLEPDGERRALFYEECWKLVPAASGASSPVRVVRPRGSGEDSEESCPGCGGALVDLLDFDLTDPRTAFLGFEGGTRLRIATCPRCLPWSAPILTEVDTEGGSVWSPVNQPPAFVGEAAGPWPEERLVLGERHRTPLAARPFVGEGPASQVGGYPSWLQEPEYPLCPECGEPMTFIGQVQLADLATGAEDLLEGVVYAFLHASCGRAATLYQQL